MLQSSNYNFEKVIQKLLSMIQDCLPLTNSTVYIQIDLLGFVLDRNSLYRQKQPSKLTFGSAL